jgi:hypothetical protein
MRAVAEACRHDAEIVIIDPESPLLCPARHALPALLRALALGRPADEQQLLVSIADLVQTLGARSAIELVEVPPL